MIKDYGESINPQLKAAKVCFIISLIVGALGILGVLINIILYIAYELYEIGFLGLVFAFFLAILFWVINPIVGISLSTKNKPIQNEITETNDKQNVLNFILFNFIIGGLGCILIPVFVYISSYDWIYIASAMSGTLNLPNLIGLIFLIIIYNKIKKIQPMPISVNQSSTQPNDNLDDRVKIPATNINELLSKVGKKFFIKYFYQLRDWNTLDILDEISENYSESSKIERINYAKAIFTYNLDYMVLLDIFNPAKSNIDEETRNNAKTILQKEYKTEIGEILN